jgi:hypothetical protein
MAGSSANLTFTMEFDCDLPATAGPVKLYSCTTHDNATAADFGVVEDVVNEFVDDGTKGDATAGDGIYTAKLTMEMKRSDEAHCFTFVVGAHEPAPNTIITNSDDLVVVSSFAGDDTMIILSFEPASAMYLVPPHQPSAAEAFAQHTSIAETSRHM